MNTTEANAKKSSRVAVNPEANRVAKRMLLDVEAKSTKPIRLQEVYSAMIEVASKNESVIKNTIKSLIDSK